MSPIDIFTDLMFASVAGVIGYGGSRLVGEIWAKLIVQSDEANALRAKLKRCSALVPGLIQRRGRLRSKLLQTEGRRRTLDRQVEQLRRQIADFQRQDDELIRVVGHRRPGSQAFKAVLINRHVQAALREGRPHGLLDSSWAKPQDVEIWASGLPEAKASLNGRFPVSLGFVLIEMHEMEQGPEKANVTGDAA